MNNFIKRIENRVKGLHKSRLINPHIHWAKLVQFFLVMALILIIFGFYLLFRIRNEQIFQVIPSSSENPPSLIKEDLLEKVNTSFQNKKNRSEQIKTNQILFSDPS